MEVLTKSLAQLQQLLQNREVCSLDLTECYLQQVEKMEPQVSAFLTICADLARKRAKEIDASLAAGEAMGPLAGIPMALKDNLCMEGLATTCASRILADFHPPYNATVVAKLLQAGAVVIGKCNMDEFAMGSTTENSGFYPTKNPWDSTRVPGGSSGGSAAAVAALEAPYALGSDTGGSIRQPASFCGVVGMKPTYGAVSRYGLVAFASSLDQIGPFTRSVADNALVLTAIAGHDPKDSTSIPDLNTDYTQGLTDGVRGLQIGLPKEFFEQGLDPQVGEVIRRGVSVLESLGAKVDECSLPHMKYAMPAYYLIAPAECSSNLARYDGVSYGFRAKAQDLLDMCRETRAAGFGPEVKQRIMLGTYALSSGYYDAYYLRAQKVRTLIRQDFAEAFAKFDVLISPTAPLPAYGLGEKTDPLAMYLGDIYTIPVNLAGLPGLSVPAGFVGGLPVGMQLIGAHFQERLLYRTAYAFEQHTGFCGEIPPLAKEVY